LLLTTELGDRWLRANFRNWDRYARLVNFIGNVPLPPNLTKVLDSVIPVHKIRSTEPPDEVTEFKDRDLGGCSNEISVIPLGLSTGSPKLSLELS
jgi:hypothetical protein